MTRDGRPLVHCFAGCDQLSVIDALMRAGLWPEGPVERDPSSPHRFTTKPDGLDEDGRRQRQRAIEIWRDRLPIAGTPAEDYLRKRGITGPLPDCLAFGSAIPYWHSINDRPAIVGRYPALLASITLEFGTLAAVQITYLDNTSPTKATIIAPDTGELLRVKKIRGVMEHASVKLAQPRDILGIAEGVETAMSASILFRYPTWAVCGVERLPMVKIPEGVRQVVIFRDAGKAGGRLANKAFDVYSAQGFEVLVCGPDEPHGDHNDWLLAGAGRAA